jgi:diguanylate cyclase (GGDEF)-like protein
MGSAPVGPAARTTRKGTAIPEGETPESCVRASARAGTRALESDQGSADRHQTASDRDQTASDRAQQVADLDQLTADHDHSVTEGDSALAHDQAGYEPRRTVRRQTAQTRPETAQERFGTALVRDATALARDQAALARDKAAQARDHEAEDRDLATARVTTGFGPERATTGTQILLQAARDRRRAAEDRAQASAHRAAAARDRELAAQDRERAAADRAAAARERVAAAMDALTGAWQRGPGLVELQRDIDRARRGTGSLTLAYVDVDRLKVTNDSRGHQAGDALLSQVVEVIRTHLRSYETVVRMGGDEFLCAFSDTPVEQVRRRFDEISAELARALEPAFITVGFSELAPEDARDEVVARADADLLAKRAAARVALNGGVRVA